MTFCALCTSSRPAVGCHCLLLMMGAGAGGLLVPFSAHPLPLYPSAPPPLYPFGSSPPRSPLSSGPALRHPFTPLPPSPRHRCARAPPSLCPSTLPALGCGCPMVEAAGWWARGGPLPLGSALVLGRPVCWAPQSLHPPRGSCLCPGPVLGQGSASRASAAGRGLRLAPRLCGPTPGTGFSYPLSPAAAWPCPGGGADRLC